MKAVGSICKWSYYLAILPVVVGVCAWQGWAWWSWAQSPPMAGSSPNAATEKAVQIQIPSGTAAQQIGEDLEAAGLIRSSYAWRLWTYWLRLHDKQGGYKAGTYTLSPAQPLPAIAEKIWTGEVMQLSFTIPEGWSLQQMATYFETLGFFKAQDFLAAASQIPKQQFPWLPDELPHLEGYLFPDTYQLPSDRVSPQQVIQQMLKRFEQVALPIYEQQKNQTKLSIDEWVTLASIVEKEAVIPEERPLIAGVFTQRLQRGMKLETDPTVEYGLGIRQTADQPLTYAQVGTASPYNTYLNPGLPPTPIASPGVASLKATLNPENTDYLFFVARYDGTHIFSKTLEAHEAAKNAVRQQRQTQQQASPSPSP
ncbi:MAG: endolytic transglycosylase MltG [Coleofasciculus sp. S288]|nr:endolytic transglycosylase MltG [Coleofasciculus sp. S288]